MKAVPIVGIKVLIDGYEVFLSKYNTEKKINTNPIIEKILLKVSEQSNFLYIKM